MLRRVGSSLSLWLRVRRGGEEGGEEGAVGKRGQPSEPRIFISYRRDDTRFFSSRVCDRLVAHFGKEHVFRDVDDIAPGRPWNEAIDDAISSCNVFVVLIGRGWLTATDDEGKRRLDNEEDRHRREIEAALERKIMVFPVLMEDTEMPGADQLPETMEDLPKIQARRITDDAFDWGTQELVAAIEVGALGRSRRRIPRPAILAGGLAVIAAVTIAVIALAGGGGGESPSKETAVEPAKTAVEPAKSAAEIETSKGLMRVTEVSQPDKYPVNCGAGGPRCQEPRPGLRFLVVSFEPVGGFGVIPRAEVLDAYVQGNDGKRTDTLEFAVDTTGAKSEITMAFAPPATASDFELYWPGNDPVALDQFLTTGGGGDDSSTGGGGDDSFSQIEIGQSKDEVRSIVGEPEASQTDLGGSRECWYYGLTGEGHTVCFDEEGLVMQIE